MYLKNTPFWNSIRSIIDFVLRITNITYRWKGLKFKCHSCTQGMLLYCLFYLDFAYNGNIIRNWNIEGVVDLGANAGFFSLWLSRIHPNIRYYTLVEPNRKLVLLCHKNFKLNKVKGYLDTRWGLVGEPGPFYTASSECLSTVQPLPWMETKFKIIENVPFLDPIQNSIPPLKTKNNLLKIDIEGSEEKFLCLANKYWIKDNFRCVIIESHYPRTSYESVKKFMCKELGYTLVEESGGDLSGNSYFELKNR
jgi:FkbM family methyltransferase